MIQLKKSHKRKVFVAFFLVINLTYFFTIFRIVFPELVSIVAL